MKVRITKDHDYRLKPAVTMAFKARPEPIRVPKAIGKALIAAGAAEAIEQPADQED